MTEKVLDCLKAYREVSLEQNAAAFYNKFIAEIKKDFSAKPLWFKVVEDNLGLITVNECSSGNATTDEAKDFLSMEKVEDGEANGAAGGSGDDNEDLVSVVKGYSENSS